MEIYKFGGLALQNADSIRKVIEIIRIYEEKKLIIVVSAIGKNTRLLCRYANAYFNQKHGKDKLYETFSKNHFNIINELGLSNQYKSIQKITQLIEEIKHPETPDKEYYPRFFDSVICYGELVSSLILSTYLQRSGITNKWIDIRKALITDNKYNAAEVIHKQSMNLVKRALTTDNRISITQGFIGRSKEGYSSTLGFEGSDYTAALLANYLDAKKVTLWKDVPGIMSADPKTDKNAVMLNHLSYDEVAEYTHAGAKVLHPKTIKPLKEKKISLEVKSFLSPETQGSIIDSIDKKVKETVIIKKENQELIKSETKDASRILGKAKNKKN